LRRAEDMAGREETDAEFSEVAHLTEWEPDFFAVPLAHPGLHEAERGRGRDGSFVAPGVVAVGVGDEGEWLREARVEAESGFWQTQDPVVPDLDHGASGRVL